MATPAAKRGRPSVFTDSERKKKRKDYDKQKNTRVVYLGDALGRWNALKDKAGLQSHADVASLLLDT